MKWYSVDIPNPNAIRGGGADDDMRQHWVNVGQFMTQEAAEAFLKNRWGIEKEDAYRFIVEVERI